MTLRAVLAVLLLAVPAAAQPVKPAEDPGAFDKELNSLFSANGLTSAQAAARAVRTSPQIRARAAAVDQAIAQEQTAELARIPFVGVTGRYTRLSPIDPPNLGGGFSIPVFENQYLGEATAQINLSDYLVRYPKQIAAARASADAARLDQRANELDVAADARITYYEWVRAKLQTLVAKRQLEQVRSTLGQVRALADAQRVSRADLMRVESEEANADHAADRLQQISELREEQLRILIGAAPTESLSIGEDVRVDITAPPSPGPLDQLVTNATRDRLDFQAFDTNIEAVEKQRAAEKSSLFPKLSAFGVADYARPNQRIFPQEDKFKFTWQAGVQLTWTLNEALVSNAQDKRFAAQLRELRANRESLERGTRIAVLSAQQNVDIAQRSFITSKKGLDAANESYRVRQALLAAQRATAVELVDAEANLTRARITAVNARIDLRVALVELEHAIGADAKAADTKR